MLRLSFLIILIICKVILAQKSPHGKNFKVECEDCHTQFSWKVNLEEIKFDHNKTKFELLGQHKNIDCKSCHIDLKFEQTKINCSECHIDVHKNTLGQDCKRCHTSFSWVIEDINRIHTNSRFPLVGKHKTINCQQCHKFYSTLKFDILDIECYSCHRKDYESASNPNHLLSDFPKNCTDCHNINNQSWSGYFDHNFFPLLGGHSQRKCSSCHLNNNFTKIDSKCQSCHLNDFNRSQNPNHIRLNISYECNICHSLNPRWKPALFPLHNNFYPLTGRHNLIKDKCFDCHKGNYSSTPRECVGCHLTNFNQTTSPNHSLLNFPQQCETCHTTNSWIPSNFNHDQMYFPIFSGKHRNTWNDCRICHINTANYGIFSCLNCHEHRKSRMDDKHRDVPGYVYESNACLSCHPTGTKPNLNIKFNSTEQ
ncbi:MAG: hypothetical protein NZM09_06410 [Ignavibacterium sp.]|nr:hypothetical protein [Ignavibacterium sp.]MDW8375313.1 hypothetical protein [Ignavibacteriales bacterium]